MALLPAGASAGIPKAEIVVVKFSDKGNAIKVLEPGGEPRTIATGHFRHPTWSPDRAKIAFVEIDPETYDPLAIWVMNRDGSDQRKVVELGGVNAVSSSYRIGFDWSPDSTRIVYSDRVDREATYDLFVVAVDSGEITQLTSNENTDEEEPDWSPTDDVVVFHQGPKDDGTPLDDYDAYSVDIESRETTRLTHHKWWDYSPQWSPDGRSIAFFTNRDERYFSEDGPYMWEVYLMEADGTNERRLTRQSTRKEDMTWAPDGSAIAYSSFYDDDLAPDRADANIYAVDVSSRKLRRVTTKGTRAELFPTWSPNSRWMAFVVQKRGGRESDVWAVRLKDGTVRDLTSRNHSEIRWATNTPGGPSV
jgi:TolB protein